MACLHVSPAWTRYSPDEEAIHDMLQQHRVPRQWTWQLRAYKPRLLPGWHIWDSVNFERMDFRSFLCVAFLKLEIYHASFRFPFKKRDWTLNYYYKSYGHMRNLGKMVFFSLFAVFTHFPTSNRKIKINSLFNSASNATFKISKSQSLKLEFFVHLVSSNSWYVTNTTAQGSTPMNLAA